MKQPLVKLALATYLLSHSLLGAAQSSDNVYQIEVIIFERQDAGGGEYWPKNIELSYPANQARLIDPERQAQREAQLAQEAGRRESFALSDEFLASIQANSHATSGESEPSVEGSSKSNGAGTDQEANSVRFNTFLPEDFKRLKATKAALDRRRNYRVLFHETWLQALQPTEQAPALAIVAGGEFGDHHELEGYLTLSLGRYLHMEANLWLTEFTANRGQTIEHWPPLPSPNDNQINKIDASTVLQMQDGYIHLTDTAVAEPVTVEWTGPQADPYAELLEAPYLIQNIAVLRQKRRMRSGELHYLDHPKLGILVKIEKAEAPE